MTGLIQGVPVQLAVGKRLGLVGIGNLQLTLSVGKAVEVGKFAASALGNRATQFAFEVTEKPKGAGGRELFAHKKQRWRWRQQTGRQSSGDRSGIGDCVDALAQGTVTNLIVILQKGNKSRGGQVSAGLTAAAMIPVGGWFALKGEAFGQTAP